MKTGIHPKKPIICSNCGKRVGWVKLKASLKWRQIWWALGIALAFELIANIVVYLMFR